MAIDQGTATLSIATQERSRRIIIDTMKGTDPIISVIREVVKTAPDGTIVATDPAPGAVRYLSHIMKETQPFKPATDGVITALELAQLIAARADMWREYDIANPAPADA